MLDMDQGREIERYERFFGEMDPVLAADLEKLINPPKDQTLEVSCNLLGFNFSKWELRREVGDDGLSITFDVEQDRVINIENNHISRIESHPGEEIVDRMRNSMHDLQEYQRRTLSLEQLFPSVSACQKWLRRLENEHAPKRQGIRLLECSMAQRVRKDLEDLRGMNPEPTDEEQEERRKEGSQACLSISRVIRNLMNIERELYEIWNTSGPEDRGKRPINPLL